MEYLLEDLSQFEDDPISFMEWLNSEGFIDIEDKKCKKCGSELQIRGIFTYSFIFFYNYQLCFKNIPTAKMEQF